MSETHTLGRWRVTVPAPRATWEVVLREDPTALPSQSPGWLDARCALGGHADASRLYEGPGERLLVLPTVRRRPFGSGRAAIQASYDEAWGIGGVLAAGGATREDVASVVEDLLAKPALQTIVRPNPLLADAWEAARVRQARVKPRLAHVLDLTPGFDRIWGSASASGARANARKAERAGVTVERGTSSTHLAAYYELFDRSLERWAGRQHEPAWLARWRGHRRDSEAKLAALSAHLGDAFGIWLAKLDGRPVAAAIVLRDANAHYTRGAMDEELAGATRANYLLHRHAIRDACEAGCRHYHFGETGRSSSLAFFKTRFGADARPYAEYRFERLPLTAVDRGARGLAKRLVGFVEPS